MVADIPAYAMQYALHYDYEQMTKLLYKAPWPTCSSFTLCRSFSSYFCLNSSLHRDQIKHIIVFGQTLSLRSNSRWRIYLFTQSANYRNSHMQLMKLTNKKCLKLAQKKINTLHIFPCGWIVHMPLECIAERNGACVQIRCRRREKSHVKRCEKSESFHCWMHMNVDNFGINVWGVKKNGRLSQTHKTPNVSQQLPTK